MCLQHTRKLALLKGKACKALCGQKISLFGVLIGSRNGRDAVCSPSFCWSIATKIVQTESRDCKLACKLCRGAAYLDHRGKVMYYIINVQAFQRENATFFCTAISYQPFCYFRGLKSGFWTAGVRINRIFAAELRGCAG